MTRSLRLFVPSGEAPACELPASGTLAQALTAAGIPLNLRCGGHGRCRGCLVHLGDREVQSCQMAVTEVPPDITEIRIPESSWRDDTLSGVSAFEVLAQVPLPHRRAGIGLALDIGTTTVAAQLWDLATGKALAAGSRLNAQAQYGDNVLARITNATRSAEGPRDLQRAVIDNSIQPLLRELLREAGLGQDLLTEGTVAGNPVMLHTLLGLPLDGFAKYPFQPEFLDARSCAEPLGFPLTLLPALGAFVGADITAGALVSGMIEAEPPRLLMDFGTNGEILLKHAGGYLATATAAGPAFEGGRLSCGALARRGVISTLRRSGGRWLPDTPEARGISGAAYVDFLALAHAAGLLNAFGRFDPVNPEVVTEADADGDPERRVYVAERQYISEADVAELLQAKAAIAGGVATLLELAGIEAGDLCAVFVAGGFGYHLDITHACAIGLLPDVSLDRIHVIGNASLGGASLALLNPEVAPLGTFARAVEAIELNQVAAFEEHFTDALGIGPMED